MVGTDQGSYADFPGGMVLENGVNPTEPFRVCADLERWGSLQK